MDEFFASQPATNDSYLCVGPLTKSEAVEAADAGIGSGLGYYFYVSSMESKSKVEILGKLAARTLLAAFDLLGLIAYSPA